MSYEKVLYRRIECPHCGNEIMANNLDEPKKCKFCRRKYGVKVHKSGKKVYFEPILIDFTPDEQRGHNEFRGSYNGR